MVLLPTEIAFVNFDGLVRNTEVFPTARYEHQHSSPAEHAPISDGILTEAIFFSGKAGWFAAHDVVRDK